MIFATILFFYKFRGKYCFVTCHQCNDDIWWAGSQRVPLPVRQVRGLLQEQEGVRGPLGESSRSQAGGQRWSTKDEKRAGGAKQGTVQYRADSG